MKDCRNKSNKNKFVFLLLFLLNCNTSIAQPGQFIFRHLTTDNGLINNIVHALYQDSKGYIWIGTIDGLQRYDGSRFVNYLPDMHDPEALHSGWINGIFEDSRKRFWVGTNYGAPYLLNRTTGKFYNYGLHMPQGRQVMNGVWKFLEDRAGDIWIMSNTGYYKLNNTTNSFEDVNSLAGVNKKNGARDFGIDARGNIWFVTDSALKYYDIVSRKIFDKNNNPARLEIFNLEPDFTTFLASGNYIWLGIRNRKELLKYDLIKNTLTNYPLENDYTNYLSAKTYKLTGASDGSVMVDLFNNGIAFYDPVKDAFTQVSVEEDDPNGLHGVVDWGTITFKDREGNMWVSGNDKGLNIFNPGKRKFSFYGDFREPNTHDNYSANGFIQDPVDGDIYVGYYFPTGGIVRFSSDLVFKKKYLFKNADVIDSYQNQIWCLFQNENGEIWAPNQQGTILKLDPRSNQLSVIKDSALHADICTIQRDEKKDIWLGCWAAGLKKIDYETHAISSFPGVLHGSPDIGETVLSMSFEGDSIIWAGTIERGLLRFDKRTNTYAGRYLLDENNPASISSNTIKKIIRYNADTLLLATAMGIDIFDEKKKIFSCISVKNGLPGNVVETIMLDDNRNLLAACDGGFCKINMHDLSVTRYGSSDGITDNIFTNASLRLKDGRFLVSTDNGFIAFDPKKLGGNLPGNPVITGFKVFDKNIGIDSLTDTDIPVKLSYKDNNIMIEFGSLPYSFSDEVKYYYRMAGVDKDWLPADRSQAAHYNQLQSGDYIFEVKCLNREGLAAEKIARLHIRITPPFWKTWWFLLLAFLLFFASGYFLFRWLHKRRKEKEQLRINYEREIAVMEMKTLRAQMNPHFIFNSLNAINTFILKNDQDNATGYLNKFSQLMRLILDNSRNDWVLLEDELKALRLYIELESVRFDDVFSYVISVSPDVQAGSVLVPPLIIQPYVENAIRHGLVNRDQPGGKLGINVWRENNELFIQIEDNGIGRAEAEKMKNKKNTLHQSHGMNITAERIAILKEINKVNANLQVTDLAGDDDGNNGTRILLTIQYKTYAGDHY